MNKIFLIFILLLLVNSHKLYADDFLNSLIKEALENNPQIEALEKNWQAKRAKILSAITPPQPKAQIVYFDTPIQTKVGPQDKKFGLQQNVPFPTKLLTKRNIVAKETEIAYAKYQLARLGLKRDIKIQFYDYYFLIKSLEILEEERHILLSMKNVVERKYETNQASQALLVKIDLEISNIDKRILDCKKNINMIAARINKLLNRPQENKLKLPSEYKLKAEKIKIDKEKLLKLANTKSPLLLIDKLSTEKEKFKLSLEKQGWLPDLGFSVSYIEIGEETTSLPNDGEDALSFGVSFTFPLWFWKITSDIEAQENKFIQAQKQYEDKKNFISFKIEDLFFKLNTNYRLVDLYENIIIPQAVQNFSTSRIAYESGADDFLNWLDAERNLIIAKLGLIKQIVDYKNIEAELEYIVGGKILD